MNSITLQYSIHSSIKEQIERFDKENICAVSKFKKDKSPIRFILTIHFDYNKVGKVCTGIDFNNSLTSWKKLSADLIGNDGYLMSRYAGN